jgi:glutamate synthase (ferredoxin)
MGRSDLLRRRREETPRKSAPSPPPARGSTSEVGGALSEVSKTQNFDLDFLTNCASVTPDQRAWVGKALKGPAHSNGHCFEDDVLQDKDVMAVIDGNSGSVDKEYFVTNVDRSLGGRISGVIARKYGDYGFEGAVNLKFTGAAGQSFGCWNIKGLNLRMEGDVNDYLGKGMNGGSITVLPPKGSDFTGDRNENAIAGNTCLYGATGGKVFLSGRAGERFGVRNAGTHAVIEGSGDHLGEYMTGGVIIVIGATGRNIGAGMSGGLIYLHDPDEHVFEQGLVNKDNSSNTKRIVSADGEQQIRDLIQEHLDRTESPAAKRILDDWENQKGKFWQVAPASEQSSRFVAPAEPSVEGVLKDATTAMAARSRSSSPATGSTMTGKSRSRSPSPSR